MSPSTSISRRRPFSTIKARISSPTPIFPHVEEEVSYHINRQNHSLEWESGCEDSLIQEHRNESGHHQLPLISMCRNDIGSHHEEASHSKHANFGFSNHLTRPVTHRNRSGSFQLMPTIHQSDTDLPTSRQSSPGSTATYETTHISEDIRTTKSKGKAKASGDQNSDERIDSVHSNIFEAPKSNRVLSESHERNGEERRCNCRHEGCRKYSDVEVTVMGGMDSTLPKKLEQRERRALVGKEATEQAMLRNLPVMHQSQAEEQLLSYPSASTEKKSPRYRRTTGQPLTKEQRRASLMRWCEGALSVLSIKSTQTTKSSRRSSIFSFWSKSDKQTRLRTHEEPLPPSQRGHPLQARPRIPPLYQSRNGPPQFGHHQAPPPWMGRVTVVTPGSTPEEELFLATQSAEDGRHVSVRELQEQERMKRQAATPPGRNGSRLKPQKLEHGHQPSSDMRGDSRASNQTLEELRRTEMMFQRRLQTAGIANGLLASSSRSLLECNELAKREEESAQRQAQALVLRGTLIQQRQQILTHRHPNTRNRASSSIMSRKSIQTKSGDLKELHRTRSRSQLDSGSIRSMNCIQSNNGDPKRYHRKDGRCNSIETGWFPATARVEPVRYESTMRAVFSKPGPLQSRTNPLPRRLAAPSRVPETAPANASESIHESYRRCNLNAVQRAYSLGGKSTKEFHLGSNIEDQPCAAEDGQSMLSFTGNSTEDFHVVTSIHPEADTQTQSAFPFAGMKPSDLCAGSSARQFRTVMEIEQPSFLDGPSSQPEQLSRVEVQSAHDITGESTWTTRLEQFQVMEHTWSAASESTKVIEASPAGSMKQKPSTREPGTAANKLFYAHLIEPVRRSDGLIVPEGSRPHTAAIQRQTRPPISDWRDFKKLHHQ